MSILNKAWNWNATIQEEKAAYPCDSYMVSTYRGMIRAIDIAAPKSIVFRWICQLKLAPYSYDMIDNFGRQSPRKLIPGTEKLENGQNFLIGQIVEFEVDSHITAVIDPKFEHIYGNVTLTYAVQANGPSACRLVVKVNVAEKNWFERLRNNMLAWGDLIMMRKQLITIKGLAEDRLK